MVLRSTSVMRLIERMELPSTRAEITARFFSAESVYISLDLSGMASQHEVARLTFRLAGLLV
jgi:hypothetical protein